MANIGEKRQMTTKETKQKNNRCFVMMPFSTPEGYEKDHFIKVYEQIINQQ